jgi:hypothetical protein
MKRDKAGIRIESYSRNSNLAPVVGVSISVDSNRKLIGKLEETYVISEYYVISKSEVKSRISKFETAACPDKLPRSCPERLPIVGFRKMFGFNGNAFRNVLYARILSNRNIPEIPEFTDRLKAQHKYPSERLAAEARHPENTGAAKWRRQHTTWDHDYFNDHESFWNSIVRRTEFRRKFRVPRQMFDSIFQDMKGSGRFRDISDVNIRGARPHPLNLKFASSLRVIGLGAGMDIAEEGSGIAEQTVAKFIPDWLEWFVQQNFHKWVKGIGSVEELRKVEGDFAKMGFPGCASQTDAMHAHFPACPSAKKSLYSNGKEGEPTIVWNVHSDAQGNVLAVSDPSRGTMSDKTIVQVDPFSMGLKNDRMFTEYEFQVKRRDGTSATLNGAYSSCDGGYHKWVTLIASQKNPLTRAEKIYTKRQESCRKRIECIFGLLKKRTRILRNGLPYSSLRVCDNIMRASCILHNMLLACDGLDDIGEYEDDWEKYFGIESGIEGTRRHVETVEVVRKRIEVEIDEGNT